MHIKDFRVKRGEPMPRFWTRYTVRQRIQAFVSLLVVFILLELLLSRTLHNATTRVAAAEGLAIAFLAGAWSLIAAIAEGLWHIHPPRDRRK